ncbi:MAG: GntR family transcriptional regulator [Rhodobacteraceae bacterium]|nr:GntR family transcriptional regulator [Paracoccaceae bacterium]
MTLHTDARTPRYAAILRRLRAEIAEGVHPVGASLPSEAALCRRFEVSRFTVREALRRLQQDGMVERVQGAGSRVLRATPGTVFVQDYRSVGELTRYAAETRLVLLDTGEITLDADLAGRIGGIGGEVWFLLRGLRHTAEGGPLALVESYVPLRFAAIAPDLARGAGPIYAGLARASGDTIARVEQETQALPAPYHVAEALELTPGAPALRILRRYSGQAGPLIASFNWHHGGDRYIHRTRIELDRDQT